MTQPIKRIRYNPRRHAVGNVGESPGTIDIPAGALKPVITMVSYNETDLIEGNKKNIEEAFDQIKKHKDHTHWIRIRGLGDAELIKAIGAYFHINSLVLEDITNIH